VLILTILIYLLRQNSWWFRGNNKGYASFVEHKIFILTFVLTMRWP